MAAEPGRPRKTRSPSNFLIFKKVGETEDGRPTFAQVGEELGMSARAALEKAQQSGALDGLTLGDEISVVNERQWAVKPLKLSF